MTNKQYDDPLAVDVGRDGTIHLSGDVDMAGVPMIEATLAGRDADYPVVVDVTAVSFMDSSGLRVLLGAAARADERGTWVVLRAVGPEVARLLDITGATGRFVVERAET